MKRDRKRHWASVSREYRSREHALDRCNNPNAHNYARYGGRGIRVCKRWTDSFRAFLEDLGPRPEGMTLDRIENDGHYSCGKCDECRTKGWPANCRWATYSEQCRNQRRGPPKPKRPTAPPVRRILVHDGRSMCLAAWARELGIPVSTLKRRLRAAWPVELVLSQRGRPRAHRCSSCGIAGHKATTYPKRAAPEAA